MHTRERVGVWMAPECPKTLLRASILLKFSGRWPLSHILRKRPNFLPQMLDQPCTATLPLIETWISPWHGCTQRYAKIHKLHAAVLYGSGNLQVGSTAKAMLSLTKQHLYIMQHTFLCTVCDIFVLSVRI